MENSLHLDQVLAKLYQCRFSDEAVAKKAILWKVLVDDFLSQRIPANSSVLDIGGGYCEFLNAIQAREKHLIDLNPNSSQYAHSDIHFHRLNILEAKASEFGTRVDVCFISNFLEHLPNFYDLLKVLAFVKSVLKPNGRLLIIQPNFRYAYKNYFDFIDHSLPITDKSLVEALQASGFQIEELIPRFLPFSTKSRHSSKFALKVYLRLPLVWRFFGKQLFLIAKPE